MESHSKKYTGLFDATYATTLTSSTGCFIPPNISVNIVKHALNCITACTVAYIFKDSKPVSINITNKAFGGDGGKGGSVNNK